MVDIRYVENEMTYLFNIINMYIDNTIYTTVVGGVAKVIIISHQVAFLQNTIITRLF